MAKFIPVETFDLIIFGGTGDLSQRKLLPALYHRYADGQIPAESRIVGVSRTEMSDEEFRAFAFEACEAHTKDPIDKDCWAAFEKLLSFATLDATDPSADWSGLKARLGDDDRPAIFYLAVTPKIYVPICEAIGKAGLADGDARVVLEKPIGTDLESARTINAGVGEVFSEDRIYRIDHYLGKETVQNLLVLRFGNTLFEPLWNRTAIDHIQITVSENVGVGDRAGYYDSAGAVRDMLQNHLLQLLCLIAMEPPNSINADEIRTEKIKVLNALRPMEAKCVGEDTVRAQYGPGTVGGEKVKGYLEELEDGESDTETFVAVRAWVDNWRWARVPFYLRTGKRMRTRHSEIVVQFREAPHAMFGEDQAHSNRLIIRLQPDEGVQLYVQIKEPGPGGLRVQSLPLNLSYAETFQVRYPDAYERLLMDVVRGNLALFMRREEVEEAWEWVDGLLESWSAANTPVFTYSAGLEDGPVEARMLLRQDGRDWWSNGK
ncbi:MAG: glucose-6-phosphate dehydrogenase [Henriciella sp.]|uniref:glucose-6-phosphate dehydrogenase n=1 Tax=Henriciella sp. TaxID=1968823 RepID=UPI000C0F4A3B|nr:glucose-6-phosphate dehydrogenase [Henriciella sp.]MAN74611.1 glucose-6-phosphate dehydrogenase [Henriciella sp.]MBF32723.1 glucose-6-phosphate dehydrogenase [Hyphomonadaceae bacterium]PHR76945.1 MAG: glucose-6-phosphate dehydrogenase [Henriciella sp.]|tara:strand:+ start:47009 stop:48478 length:1470 start_codon:yes stop_codon:yes gene_type:complete